MKLIPAFFLLCISLIHLIYVIAAPKMSKADLEKVKTRKAAAALSRFKKSKRFVPVRFSLNRRNDIAARIWNYAKYVRIMGKRFLASSKARIAIRMVAFHKIVLKHFPSQGVRKTCSHRKITEVGNLTSGGVAFEEEEKRKAIAAFQKICVTRIRVGRKWPVLRVTASAYETFKQIAHELVMRVQRTVVNVAPKTILRSLRETGFEIEVVTRFAKQVAMVLPPIAPYESLPQLLRKQKERELLSSKFVPVPSAAPLVELCPDACPEPSAKNSFKPTLQLHDIKASASPVRTTSIQ